jgi:glycine betaine/proline transport system ATP-binding protein
MSIIEVADVWKVFGPHPEQARALAAGGASRDTIQADTGALVAVGGVTFSVERGETFVVMGLSGSGKSTLIRCLSRLVEPTAGQIRVCGQDLLGLDETGLRELRRHQIAMVFQHFGLFPHRRVLDNVAYGLEVQGLPRAQRHQRASEVLERVGLAAWAQHYPQQLSGGMQQRVGLARALAVDPEVLFFDEPFSALDPLIRADMQDELVALQRQLERTLVFITHDFAEALKLADRIAIMRDGVFVQVGTPTEILTAPADDYVRAFTRDAPKTKVLTAADLMRPLDRGWSSEGGRTVAGATTLEVLLPQLLASPAPLVVTDGAERPIGLLVGADVGPVLRPDPAS